MSRNAFGGGIKRNDVSFWFVSSLVFDTCNMKYIILLDSLHK